MITHELIQGTPEWHAFRAEHLTASDAPAMMGCSPYKTRTALLAEKHTGIAPEVDDATQRRFDDGHRFEVLARPLAEEIIGEELFPVVGSEGKLGASFDGLSLLQELNWEHKSLNDELRAILPENDVGSADIGAALPMFYRIQMEQQCAVSGAGRSLFTASKWSDAGALIEARHCWYTPDMELRQRIIAGWAQFEKDLAAYVPEVAAPIAKAEAIAALPSVFVQATGMVTASNLAEFRDAATAFIANIKTELATDQDFADADETVKFCKQAEGNIESVKQGITAQMSSVDEVLRTLDHIAAQLRDKRLVLDKLVKSEKEARKLELTKAAGDAYAAHIISLQAEVGGIQLLAIMPRIDFGAAVKGLKSLASMKEKLDTALRDGKFAADQIAKDVRAKLAWCKTNAEGKSALFPDLQQIIVKPFDDFTLLITSRIEADNKAREEERQRIEAAAKEKAEVEAAAKLAEETARIRAEEEAKAHAKAAAEQEKQNTTQSEAVMRDGARPALVQTESAAPAKSTVGIIDENRSDEDDAARYRWLRSRMVGADFDFNGNGITVLAFEFPRNIKIGGDCDKNIDAAMAAPELKEAA